MGDLVQRLRGVLRFEEVPGELRVIGALEMEAADRIEALTAERDALRLDLAAATRRAEAGMALADEAAQAVAEAQADIAEASAMCEEMVALRARVAEMEAIAPMSARLSPEYAQGYWAGFAYGERTTLRKLLRRGFLELFQTNASLSEPRT